MSSEINNLLNQLESNIKSLNDIVAKIKTSYSKDLEEARAEGYKQGQTSGIEEKLPVFNLTNDSVSAFIADKTYEEKDFAVSSKKSVVEKYLKNLKDNYANNEIEKPKAVVTSKGTYWNLIPNKTYNLDGLKFKTTGTVRQIYFPSDNYISNCRDIGGYVCEGGNVKYGKIIRSTRLPENLTKTSSATKILRDIGVTCEIDLRGEAAYSNLGWSGVKYSIYGYAYALTNTKNLKNTFVRILAELKNGGCVLLHCNAGADRTGTVVAFILGLLGVSEDKIIKDWELTCFCHWENFKIISQWAERIANPAYKEIALKEFPYGELREFFQAMKKTYGKNGETFQQQCVAFLTKKVGLTNSQINEFKKLLVE